MNNARLTGSHAAYAYGVVEEMVPNPSYTRRWKMQVRGGQNGLVSRFSVMLGLEGRQRTPINCISLEKWSEGEGVSRDFSDFFFVSA